MVISSRIVSTMDSLKREWMKNYWDGNLKLNGIIIHERRLLNNISENHWKDEFGLLMYNYCTILTNSELKFIFDS